MSTTSGRPRLGLPGWRKRTASSVLAGSLTTAIVITMSIVAGEGVTNTLGYQLDQPRVLLASTSIPASSVMGGPNEFAYSCTTSGPSNLMLLNEGPSEAKIVLLAITFGGNTFAAAAPQNCIATAGHALGFSFTVLQTSGTLPLPGLAYSGYVQTSGGVDAIFAGAFQ